MGGDKPGPMNYRELILVILCAIITDSAIVGGMIYYYNTNNYYLLLGALMTISLLSAVAICVNLRK